MTWQRPGGKRKTRCTFAQSALWLLLALSGFVIASWQHTANAQPPPAPPPAVTEPAESPAREEKPAATPEPDEPMETRAEARTKADAAGTKLAEYRPVSQLSQRIRKEIARYGFVFEVDQAFYYQYATQIVEGQKSMGTYSWRVWLDWNFLKLEKFGKAFLEVTLLGSPGLNYQPENQYLTRNIGSVSVLNANIYPDAAALDEAAVKWVSPQGSFAAVIGKIDLSNRFDTNRVANDGFRQFISFALQNNLSIPWSVYGGPGAFFRYDLAGRFYAMAAVSDSDVQAPFDKWDIAGNKNWYEMLELGATVEIPYLGLGHYRLTPWHSRLNGKEGWGVGLNFDQQLGKTEFVSFFRFGIGDGDVTPITTFVSAGFAWMGPLERNHDMLGVGFAWSRPASSAGFRDETLVEIFYRFAIRPWIQLSPDLQVVFHPATNREDNVIFVPGIRLNMSF